MAEGRPKAETGRRVAAVFAAGALAVLAVLAGCGGTAHVNADPPAPTLEVELGATASCDVPGEPVRTAVVDEAEVERYRVVIREGEIVRVEVSPERLGLEGWCSFFAQLDLSDISNGPELEDYFLK